MKWISKIGGFLSRSKSVPCGSGNEVDIHESLRRVDAQIGRAVTRLADR